MAKLGEQTPSDAPPPVRGHAAPAVGSVLAGKYRIEGTLGSGGMGVVFAARHLTLNQPVALKMLVIPDEQFRPEATARLLREARAAAALRGEHVVRIYDVEEDESGTPFLVMERLEGCDLDQVLRTRQRLPIAEAVALVVQAARGVAEAHRAGIVHRDLKPSNLFLVERSDGRVQLKVLDFGISKTLDQEGTLQATLTAQHSALGSPSYMSPEQVRDAHHVDTRTDIWSLGMILYELLTGKPAFQANTFPGVCARITADPPEPPSVLRPEVPRELEAIVLHCLEKDRGRRYQRLDELLVALEAFGAQPPSFAELCAPSSGIDTLPMHSRSGTAEASERDSADAVIADAGARSPRRTAAREDPSPRSHSSTLPSGGAYTGPESSASARGHARTQRSDPGPPRRRRRRAALLLGGAVALLGAAVASFLFLRAAPEAPLAPPPEPVVSSLVRLTIESVPAGARVTEGTKQYGPTPLSVSIPVTNRDDARVFLLELEGYRPYVIEHVPREGSAVVRAELVPELRAAPAASVAAPTAPAAASVSAARPAVRRVPAVRNPAPRVLAPEVPVAAAGAPGIRMQR